MATARKRLTLDIDEGLQRRLKAAAALKGISMREYCENALQSSLKPEPIDAEADRRRRLEDLEEMFARVDKIFEGRVLPGNSVDIIREARELR